jgi:hypothetical protein
MLHACKKGAGGMAMKITGVIDGWAMGVSGGGVSGVEAGRKGCANLDDVG